MKLEGRWVLSLLIVLLSGPVARAFWQEEIKATEPPLRASTFEPLPLGSIKPTGWLRDQLRIQADGLSGHIDEFWPDIKNSAWFGGTAEGWERVPYWLDGLVPLAFLADQPVLKGKVRSAVEYILAHQQADGWLGPIGDSKKHKPYDVWPLFPLFKALMQYEQATGDPRIIPRCLRAAGRSTRSSPVIRCIAGRRFAPPTLPLFCTGSIRRLARSWVLDLAKKVVGAEPRLACALRELSLQGQGQRRRRPWKTTVSTRRWRLKYGGVRHRLSGDAKDKTAIFSMLEILDRYHGQPTGIFTCDEHLAGRSPSQGTELCTVVEAMYSLEVGLRSSATPGWETGSRCLRSMPCRQHSRRT